MKPETYWRLKQLFHIGLGRSVADVVEQLVNNTADAYSIRVPSREEADALLEEELSKKKPRTVAEIAGQHFTF